MLQTKSSDPGDRGEYIGTTAEDELSRVHIQPAGAVSRRLVRWDGMAAEVVQATRHERVAFAYRGTRHLLIAFAQGVRHQGETIVDGLPRSSLREMTRKLTFVPAGCAYMDWHEPRVLTRMVYFYFDAACLPVSASLAPRMLFENSTLLDMANRLKGLIETIGSGSPYFEALGTVLAYELLNLANEDGRQVGPVRGGLTPWQQRQVASYIEEHLAKPIRLATLAQLARLSPYHFCRAFKQSLGVPPHKYHSRRRIEQAKRLLGKVEVSVTEIAMTLGYSETSSFTSAFHKTTGLTPTAYRRSLTTLQPVEEDLS
jgi:AraC family transcriptional regulator